MYFETIREQPTPPPIKGVKIELSKEEAEDLYLLLECYSNGPISPYYKYDKLRRELIENLIGALNRRT